MYTLCMIFYADHVQHFFFPIHQFAFHLRSSINLSHQVKLFLLLYRHHLSSFLQRLGPSQVMLYLEPHRSLLFSNASMSSDADIR